MARAPTWSRKQTVVICSVKFTNRELIRQLGGH